MNHLKTLGIIPARAGSKRIPNKNVRELGGIPLVGHTIRAAVESDIDFTVMSTESEAYEYVIKNWAYKEFGNDVFRKFDIIRRPSALALDSVQTDEVILHVLRQIQELGYGPETLVMLQPTSPFRTAKDINFALSEYEINSPCTVIGGYFDTGFYWKPIRYYNKGEDGYYHYDLEHIETDPKTRPGTQWLRREEKLFRENGSIYVTGVRQMERFKSKFNRPYIAYEMTEESSLDIDTEEDWERAERMYEKISNQA